MVVIKSVRPSIWAKVHHKAGVPSARGVHGSVEGTGGNVMYQQTGTGTVLLLQPSVKFGSEQSWKYGCARRCGRSETEQPSNAIKMLAYRCISACYLLQCDCCVPSVSYSLSMLSPHEKKRSTNHRLASVSNVITASCR